MGSTLLIYYWFKVPMYDFSINNIITDIINTKYMSVYWFFSQVHNPV